MNDKLIILILFFCLFLQSCGTQPRTSKPAPNVLTGVIEKKDVPVYVDAIGQAIPPITVQIRPQVQGKILEAFVQQGQIVAQGDPLYKIDPRPFEANLEEARAQLKHDEALLEYAKKTVERYKSVVEEDYISKLTFEQYESTAAAAQAQVELDRAAIKNAELNLEFCTVVAPTDGKISYFAIDVGNIVQAYDPNAITVIRPFNPIDVSFSLPQQQFEMIRIVQGNSGEWPFVATLPERPQQPYQGKTYFIDNQIDQNTGTILLKGRLENVDRDLWPGEFIRVKVLHRMAPGSLVVPLGAVLIGKNGFYIYIVDEEKKARAYDVELITRTNGYAAIASSNLKEGDIVITDGQINIAPGLVVNPKSTNPLPGR